MAGKRFANEHPSTDETYSHGAVPIERRSRNESNNPQRRRTDPDRVAQGDRIHRHRPNIKRRRKRGPVFIAIIVLIIMGVGYGTFKFVTSHVDLSASTETTLVADGTEVTIIVSPGSSAKDIATQLMNNGLIVTARDFTSVVTDKGEESQLKSGTYTFTAPMTPEELVDAIAAGPTSDAYKLTIPEGLTVAQTADVVAAALPFTAEEFIEAAKASNFVDEYPFLADAYQDSLEGYLYPETYAIANDDSVEDVIRVMLNQFSTEVADVDYSDAEAAGFSQYDVLVMASIIEREAYLDDDRDKIASVIYNRIAAGMNLQVDATVIYALGADHEEGAAVSLKDLEVDSPYNTYLVKGLTPTPICSPRLASIEAAAHPVNSDYLYYVLTSKDGHHTFADNYDDFLKAKSTYEEVFGVE